MSEDVHAEALKRFEHAEEFERENRLLAEEDLRFVAGDGQWPEQIKTAREMDKRPCLTFNRLPQFIAQVVGDARQNKPAIKIHPVDDQADPPRAELMEGIIRHIECASDADVAYMTGLEHACSGSFGHWRVVTEYCHEMTFDQDIKVRRIQNPFAVYWDSNAILVDKSDAEWCFVVEWITTEAFDSRFPKAKGEVRDWESPYTSQMFGTWLDADQRVRIAEYWRKVRTPITISQLPDGRIIEGDAPGAVATRKSFKLQIERYIVSGDKILSDKQVWPGRYIPVVSVFGPEQFIDGRVRYRSMIRHAKDPMRMYNYWQTAITEKIALAPKVPYVGTVEQFKGLERFWNNINNLNKPWVPYNPDPRAPGPPQRTTPADIQPAEIQQSNQSIDDIKATIGIYDASLGARSNETSGRAIFLRQREGDNATFAWIDNLARAIEHTGRIIVDLIPYIYDTERVIRIVGEDGAQDMQVINQVEYVDPIRGEYRVNNDLTVGKYDVVVSVGPSYATKRLEAADSMMQFIQAFPAAAPIVGDLIAKNMDWPGAEDIAKRLKTLLPPQIQMKEASPEEQAEMQAMMQPSPEQQAEMMKAELERMKLELEGLKAQAEAAKTEEETEGKRLENIQKSLEIEMQSTMQSAEMQSLIQQLVQQNIAQILTDAQTQQSQQL